MHILAICGSRNPEGQTARALGAYLAGAVSGGATTDWVRLPSAGIQACRQCDDDGWGECRYGEQCIITEDAFADVTRLLLEADAVVFATPVYFSEPSESLRAYLDRLRRVAWHGLRKRGVEGKRAAGICVAGGGGGGAPHCVDALEFVLQTCGFAVVDMIPVRRQTLDLKLETLGQAGAWFAAGGGVQ
jgi:multimeric flavodoxin WrbA